MHIPFQGDAGVFALQTNPGSFDPPRGRVLGSDLVLTIDFPRDQQPDIDARVTEFVNSVSAHLGWAADQIDRFNSTLEAAARRAVTARRQRLEKLDAYLAKSTIPVGDPSVARKTRIADVIVRRPTPTLPATRAASTAPALEPALEASVYEHILGLIRMHGRQMELTPGDWAGLGEEARRTLIVGMLNTHYEGRASAEAFNYQGKTDILIRYEGRNVFICECKFWKGADGFNETIEQLFRYVSWRDTKLAILMFVREKSLTKILERAEAALAAHPRLVRLRETGHETELCAMLHWPGDKQRHAELSEFVVHTPRA